MNESNIIEKLKNKVEIFCKQRSVLKHIVSVFIFGGNAEQLLMGKKLSSREIDLLFVVKRKLSPGKSPIDKSIFNDFCDGLSLCGKKTRLIFNGVPPLSCVSSVFLLDVIGDGLPNIKAKESGSIIIAYKPRILIFGKDVYKTLEHETFTADVRKKVFEQMLKYVKREFFDRNDKYAKRAISKNAIFAASILVNSTIHTNIKRDIVCNISKCFPELKSQLEYFLQSYNNPSRANKRTVIAYFNKYCSFYKKSYLKET
jgi:hypothetical protein